MRLASMENYYIVSARDCAVFVNGPFSGIDEAGDFGEKTFDDLRWNVVRLDASIETNPLFCRRNVPD